MSQQLHKFIPLHEVLQKAQRFHDTASALLFQWAREDDGGRNGSFFKLAAEQERVVADSLARALAGDGLGSTQTVYQNPPETIPSEEDVKTLAPQRTDLITFAAALHVEHERWIAVYDALRSTNPTRRVEELLGNCRGLVERLERQLSSAQVQLQDM